MAAENIILLTDSYKISHYLQYPPGTSKIYSYFESRGGGYEKLVFFGLQYYLKKYLSRQISAENIDEAEELLARHFSNPSIFNRAGWEYILKNHNGYLPVSIKAIPEGTIVPQRCALVTIENTDPRCFWLTNYLETLLVQIWYGTTVATNSRAMKGILLEALERSGTPETIGHKLHDFGFRGVSSVETAGMGAAAHLLHFCGSDTLHGLIFARDYYSEPVAGTSIPASEHSTMTAWGKDSECDAYRNMLRSFPEGFVAVVSDSFDIYNACKNFWGTELKQEVLERKGTLVIRPDSGDPCRTLPEILGILEEKFGVTENDKGYKVLPAQVRIIQGDGIAVDTLSRIVDSVLFAGYSLDNLSFGSGGGLLQKFNRDTLKFAFKCSAAVVNGEERQVYKEPITSPWKTSKRGRLKVIRTPAGLETVSENSEGKDLLREVFRDGKLLIDEDFKTIRSRAV